jgi:hypothetical protein
MSRKAYSIYVHNSLAFSHTRGGILFIFIRTRSIHIKTVPEAHP